jgi:hypothetical protein
MPEKYALVEYPSAINTIIRNIFQTAQRIKFTSFDVSTKYVIFGASSGGIYIFNREPCQFLKLIPTTHGSANLVQISADEENLAVAASTGLVTVFEDCFNSLNFQQQIFTEHEGNTVTALKWNGNDLYCGDSIGRVSVIILKNFLTKAMFQTPTACLMHLDSPIVQLDAYSKFLLVSTQTRSLLCDTDTERYRQVGKKARDGNFGACFFNTGDSVEVGESHTRTRGIFQTVSDSEQLSPTVFDSNVKIYCARPGVRLWQANFDANVVVTHQLRPSLSQKPSDVVYWEDRDELRLESFAGEAALGESFNFGKIYAFLKKFILTFRDDGFYIFEPSTSALLHWSAHISNIKDVKIVDSFLYVWHHDLEVSVLSLLTVEELILKSLMRKRYRLCGELCVRCLDEVEFLIGTSKKIHLVSTLETKLDNPEVLEKLAPIFQRLKECAKVPNLEKFKNGIVTVNALPVVPESVENFRCERETRKEPHNILLEQYKISKIHPNVETTNFAQLMKSSDPDNLYRLLSKFQAALDDNSCDSWCKQVFLKHLDQSRDFDSNVLEYACRAFLEINSADLTCECNFPLPKARKTVPKHYEIGHKLMEKCDREVFLKKVPYMHRFVLERLDDPAEIRARMPLVLQFSDPEVVGALSNRITYDIWDESIKLFAKLKTGRCLQCGADIDAVGAFEWTDFGLMMVQSIKPTNTIKLLKRYADLLPKGELDQFFYQYCIFSAASNINGDVLNRTLADEDVKKQV